MGIKDTNVNRQEEEQEGEVKEREGKD